MIYASKVFQRICLSTSIVPPSLGGEYAGWSKQQASQSVDDDGGLNPRVKPSSSFLTIRDAPSAQPHALTSMLDALRTVAHGLATPPHHQRDLPSLDDEHLATDEERPAKRADSGSRVPKLGLLIPGEPTHASYT